MLNKKNKKHAYGRRTPFKIPDGDLSFIGNFIVGLRDLRTMIFVVGLERLELFFIKFFDQRILQPQQFIHRFCSSFSLLNKVFFSK